MLNKIPILSTLENPLRKYRFTAYFISKLEFFLNKGHFYENKKEFLKEYPNVKYLPSLRYFLGYSQHGQDYFIYKTFFQNIRNGIFFDIGANHPIIHNNTYLFEKNGWSGFAFEPVSKAKDLWEKYRKTRFFPYAVSSKTEKLKFDIYHLYDIPQTSFVNRKENHSQLYKTIEVDGISIKDFCKKENISHIDFMSIDVEGHDLEVLEGIDFKKININVLTIENNREPAIGDKKIREFMENHGYIFYARVHYLDDIYVHKNYLSNPLL